MSLNEDLTKNASAKTVMSRIALKIDTWENWQKEAAQNLVLHAGEVAFVQIGTVPPMPKDQNSNGTKTGDVHLNVEPNQILFKVGDGVSKFKDLVWGSAKAADVYDWAKQNETEFKKWLSGETKVGGEGTNKDDPVIGDPFILQSVFNAANTAINEAIAATNTRINNLVIPSIEGLATENFVTAADTALEQKLVGTGTSTITTIKGAADAAAAAQLKADQGVADAATAQGAANTANSKVDTLIGTEKVTVDGKEVLKDAGKSVRTIANEELAAQLIPENAKDALNTLQEIAAWIQAHPDDATEFNRLLADLGTTGTGSNAKSKTVKEYVEEKVSNYVTTANFQAHTTAYDAHTTEYAQHVAKAVTTDTYLLIDCGTSTINID